MILYGVGIARVPGFWLFHPLSVLEGPSGCWNKGFASRSEKPVFQDVAVIFKPGIQRLLVLVGMTNLMSQVAQPSCLVIG